MARNENPPFGRGETFYNLFSATTQSTSDGIQFEGREWVFEDVDPTKKTYRSGRPVTCRVVRNVSGIALLPGRVARFAAGALSANGAPGGLFGGQVDGYVNTTPTANVNDLNSKGVPIDEFLPTAGAQNNDLFWVVIQGPASIKTDLATLSPSILVGDAVIGQTAATSQATTAGRIIDINANTASATIMAANPFGFIGYAMSGPAGAATTAATANNTDALVVVDVQRHF
jgi:hypothetical protein